MVYYRNISLYSRKNNGCIMLPTGWFKRHIFWKLRDHSATVHLTAFIPPPFFKFETEIQTRCLQ